MYIYIYTYVLPDLRIYVYTLHDYYYRLILNILGNILRIKCVNISKYKCIYICLYLCNYYTVWHWMRKCMLHLFKFQSER